MISTGIIRSIDSLGRVVLPKELRRTFEITTDTPLEIMTEGDAILLRKPRRCLRPVRPGIPRLGTAVRQNRLPRLPESVGRKGAGLTYFL